MKIFGFDFEPGFVLVIISAAFIKVASSQRLTWRGGVFTAFTAVFAAIVFTDPLAFYLGVEQGFLKNGLAALLALTGEGFMRLAMEMSGDRGLLNKFVERILDRVIGGRK